MSRKFPPGYLRPEDWPRLSGVPKRDRTYDPPVYRIPPAFKDRLLGYFEEEIHFTYHNDYVMPREAEDGVVKVNYLVYRSHMSSRLTLGCTSVLQRVVHLLAIEES